MEKKNLTIRESQAFLKEYDIEISKPTVIAWCLRYGIGRKIGGVWYIEPNKLRNMVENAEETANK